MTTRVCIIVGARPNFVKVAPLVRALLGSGQADFSLVYAGRADDPTLEPTLFDDLDMPRPQVFLNCGSDRLNEITSLVMAAFDQFLDTHPTDVVVVVDDLASTMAAAIVAKKRGLRLAHLVAGTRSFDPREPKEVNRLVIDALSDYLFTAGTRSNSVAVREQQSDTSHTYMVGNILIDSLRHCLPRLRQPAGVAVPSGYVVLTLNRRLLLSQPDTLDELLAELSASGLPVVAPLRPAAASVVSSLCPDREWLTLCPPLGYLEFEWLLSHARLVITDSGNVAEESTFLGVPCITLNDHAEHQETVTVGTNVLVGNDRQRLHSALATLLAGKWKHGTLPERWDGRTAERIVQILTTAN